MDSAVEFLKSEEFKCALLDQEIINRAAQLIQHLKSKGYLLQPYHTGTLHKLHSLNRDKKLRVLDHINKLEFIYELSQDPFPVEDPISQVHPEKNLVERALQFYNLGLRDDFWKTVDPHDILEIYSGEGIQLFRTFNFFHTSGYSLTDLLVNEWYILWERPKFVLQELFKYSEGILSGQLKGVQKMNVPTYIIKEIYSGGNEMLNFTPRSLLVEFGSICALYNANDESDPTPRGIIVSSKCSTNTMGSDDTDKVSVI